MLRLDFNSSKAIIKLKVSYSYMKNKKLKRSRLNKVVVLAVVLLLCGGAVLGYFKFVRNDSVAVNQEEQRGAEQADVDQAKQKAEEESQSEPLKDDAQDDDSVDNAISSSDVFIGSSSFFQVNHTVNSLV